MPKNVSKAGVFVSLRHSLRALMLLSALAMSCTAQASAQDDGAFLQAFRA